jgi:hypothetical protein
MTHLITFADPAYEYRRYETNNKVNFFDAVKGYTPDDISQEFKEANSDIWNQTRGYGYWMWKPYIILDYLNNYAKENDVVVYCDAGDFFWKDVLDQFCDDVSDEKPITAIKSRHWTQAEYTKMDCMVMMGCEGEKYLTSQIYASLIAIKNNSISRKFIEEWLEYCKDINILTDAPNISGKENFPEFIDHRHDQSIFTNLMNKYEMPTRVQGDYDPGYHDGSWTLGEVS